MSTRILNLREGELLPDARDDVREYYTPEFLANARRIEPPTNSNPYDVWFETVSGHVVCLYSIDLETTPDEEPHTIIIN